MIGTRTVHRWPVPPALLDCDAVNAAVIAADEDGKTPAESKRKVIEALKKLAEDHRRCDFGDKSGEVDETTDE